MRISKTRFTAPTQPERPTDGAAHVFGWIDDLVAAGLAEFEASEDEYPLLHLLTGEAFVLGDSSITRVR